MKRFTIVMLILVGLLMTVGCGSGGSNSPGSAKQSAVFTLDQVEAALKAAGFDVGSRQEKAYQMLGATDGCGFWIGDNPVEVYIFDLSITSGKDALNVLAKDGLMGQRMEIHNNVAILLHNHPDRDKIKEAIAGMS